MCGAGGFRMAEIGFTFIMFKIDAIKRLLQTVIRQEF